MAKVLNKTKGFGSISRDCVYDNELSDRARFLYVYMACKPENWEFYQDQVAKELNFKKDTLRKYLDELIIRGWITESEQQNDGKFGCLEYVIEIKRKSGNLPVRKKPDTEKTRIGKNHNHKDIDNISSDNNISSDKKYIEEKVLSDDNTKKGVRFIKPTIDQIDDYIREKKLSFKAEHFYDHYESNGWMVGRTKMKDWKAACRNWERMRKSDNEEKEEKEDDKWPQQKAWIEKFCPNLTSVLTREKIRYLRYSCDPQRMSKILRYLNDNGYEGDFDDAFKKAKEIWIED